MKLTDYYLQNTSVGNEAKNGLSYINRLPEQKSGAKFQSYLTAERLSGETGQRTAKTPAKPKTDAPEANQPVAPEPKGESENDVKTAKTPETKEEKPTTAEKPVKPAKTEAELAEDLAVALDQPVSVIMQVLAALGISAAELSNPENLSAFMVELYDVGSSAGLLEIPDIAGTFSRVGEIIDGYHAENTQILGELPAGENLTESTLIPENSGLTITPELGANAASQVIETTFAAEIIPNEGAETQTPVLPDVGASQTKVKPAGITEKDGSAAIQAETPVEGEQAIQTYTAVPTQNPENFGQGGASNMGTSPDNPTKNDNAGINQNIDPGQVAFNFVSNAELAQVTESTAEKAASNPVEVVKQIVDRLKVEVKQDTTEIRLTLKPESLGEVSLKISTQNGIVTAQFMAESQRVKEIIESQFDALKNALNDKGVNVSELTVSVGQENSGDRQGQQDLAGSGRSSRRISQIIGRNAGEVPETPELPETGTTARSTDPLTVDVRA